MVNYQVGDIFFYKSNGLLGYLIRSFTKGQFNHCGIIGQIDSIPSGSDVGASGLYIYEAIAPKFQASWYPEYWINRQIELGNVHILRPNKPITNIQANCEKSLGLPYNFSDLILIVLAKFIPSLRNTDTVQGLICSEAVAKILYQSSNKVIDMSKENKCSFSEITPEDIFVSKFMGEIDG